MAWYDLDLGDLEGPSTGTADLPIGDSGGGGGGGNWIPSLSGDWWNQIEFDQPSAPSIQWDAPTGWSEGGFQWEPPTGLSLMGGEPTTFQAPDVGTGGVAAEELSAPEIDQAPNVGTGGLDEDELQKARRGGVSKAMPGAPGAPEKPAPSTLDKIMGVVGPVTQAGSKAFDAWNAVQHAKDMRDYNDKIGKWVDAQTDYINARRKDEQDMLASFKEAQGGFEEANVEFQGQLAAAREEAQGVADEFLAAAQGYLAQSQGLLGPAIAALKEGKVPAVLAPVLNALKQRMMASSVQSMVSAGMSAQTAVASAKPMVEQEAVTALIKHATAMVAGGTQLGELGMKGLQGAGSMTEILGKLAAMGMNPYTQEFQAVANVLSNIYGRTPMAPPPQPPTA